MKILRVKRVAQATVIVSSVLAVLAACANSTSPTYSLPDQVGFNFRWSAEPGVGLTSDAAIIARAYLESAFISYRTGENNDVWPTPNKYSYPGYDRAVPKSPVHDMQIVGMSMPGLEPPGTRTVGTFYAHLLELKKDESAQPQTAQANPLEWQATMCVWVDALDIKSEPSGDPKTDTAAFNDRYHPFVNAGSPSQNPGTGRTVRLTLQQPPTGNQNRFSAGEGPARYPTTNVFGEWKIIDAKMTLSGTDSPEKPNVCANRPDNPVPPELRNRDYHTESDVPAPTLDQYPGWPASN